MLDRSEEIKRRIKTLGACVVALAAIGLGLPGPASAQFSFTSFEDPFTDATGAPANVAGSHANITTTFKLKIANGIVDGQLKDVEVDLPAGFYGNPTAIPTCNVEELMAHEGFCQPAAQVGTFYLESVPGAYRPLYTFPVYNLPTTSNEVAKLGFAVLGQMVTIQISSRTDGDYGLTAKVLNSNQGLPIAGSELILWGVPADPVNDPERCTELLVNCGHSAGLSPRPFLTVPARCEPVKTEIRGDSWQHPDEWAHATYETPPLTGCDSLDFEPTLTASPQSRSAGVPSAFDIDLSVPQPESVKGQSTPTLRKSVVTLPKGVAISPGSASGLGSCTDAQLALGTNNEISCPDSSKLGSVTVDTPLLKDPLTGDVILGAPQPGNLFRLFLVLHGPGLLIKSPGIVKPDPVSGQLTATFDNQPQLPFSKLRMSLKGGSRAALVTPSACGTYTTRAELTSWASPTPVVSESSFSIDEGCASQAQFSPGLEAGSTNPVAGAFSPFVFSVMGQDGQQNVIRIEGTLPAGMLAKLAGVPLCDDAAAASGSCPAGSQVGTVTVGAGMGASPVYVPEPGKAPTAVYLAGPYEGAPYSLVVKVPAQAGPFDLGTVTVRNGLFIDPLTAQATVKSDPLPQILEGVPITYRDIRVEINRPGFTINPTSCEPLAVTSTITSIGGQVAHPSSRFQASDCASLKFAPKFTAATSGATKGGNARALGARLAVKLSYPNAPAGTQANIKRVKVSLPRQLPSRLVTLQKACLAAVFDANPASCPAASVVGKAKVNTPLLPTPLTGPAYFVSHGGEAFPSLIMVLQGSGVTVHLVGKTFISHAGITSTTFESVPDVPFSTFELELPQGKFSALGVNGSLCSKKLIMPTDYIAQNGLTLHQSNIIKAAGCPKAKKAKRAGKTAAKTHKKHTSKH